MPSSRDCNTYYLGLMKILDPIRIEVSPGQVFVLEEAYAKELRTDLIMHGRMEIELRLVAYRGEWSLSETKKSPNVNAPRTRTIRFVSKKGTDEKFSGQACTEGWSSLARKLTRKRRAK